MVVHTCNLSIWKKGKDHQSSEIAWATRDRSRKMLWRRREMAEGVKRVTHNHGPPAEQTHISPGLALSVCDPLQALSGDR